jgi:hypothetical protein
MMLTRMQDSDLAVTVTRKLETVITECRAARAGPTLNSGGLHTHDS